MSNDINHKYYTAKDIKKYLGIDANTLYHWTQTRRLIKADIEGVGRGSENKFSMQSLATLSLAKALNNSGIELAKIKFILDGILKPRLKIFDRKTFFKLLDSKKPKKGMSPPYVAVAYEKIKIGLARSLNIWKLYKKESKLFKEKGYFLFLARPLKQQEDVTSWIFLVSDSPSLSVAFVPADRWKAMLISYHVINLLAIIKDLEEKTGLEF